MVARRGIAAICLCMSLIALLALTSCGFDGGAPAGDGPATEESPMSDLVGESLFFGNYEQDGDLDNGQEPVEWTVLDVRDGKALLLSRYGLDAVPYNEEDVDVTWETCTLRAWLNDGFLNDAFTDEELSAILVTEVDNGPDQGYPEWDADGGTTTQDRVFLLSYAEAHRYLGVRYRENSVMARAAPTTYAASLGVHTFSETKTEDGEDAGQWWLRSPSFAKGAASAVNTHGALYGNFGICSDGVCVRPAMWVDLDSGVVGDDLA